MADNRRRYANTIPVVRFLIIGMICITVCGAGLGYLWCLSDVHAKGEQIKKCEVELVRLRNRNEGFRTSIETLSSAAQLEMDFKKGRFKKQNLDRIGLLDQQRYATVVKVSLPVQSGLGELRPVANEGKQK